jgi:hypothetical protein
MSSSLRFICQRLVAGPDGVPDFGSYESERDWLSVVRTEFRNSELRTRNSGSESLIASMSPDDPWSIGVTLPGLRWSSDGAPGVRRSEPQLPGSPAPAHAIGAAVVGAREACLTGRSSEAICDSPSRSNTAGRESIEGRCQNLAQFLPGRQSELGERGIQMALDRPHGERQRARDFRVGCSLCRQ